MLLSSNWLIESSVVQAMQVTDRQCKTRRHLVMMIGAYILTQKQIKGGFVRF